MRGLCAESIGVWESSFCRREAVLDGKPWLRFGCNSIICSKVIGPKVFLKVSTGMHILHNKVGCHPWVVTGDSRAAATQRFWRQIQNSGTWTWHHVADLERGKTCKVGTSLMTPHVMQLAPRKVCQTCAELRPCQNKQALPLSQWDEAETWRHFDLCNYSWLVTDERVPPFSPFVFPSQNNADLCCSFAALFDGLKLCCNFVLDDVTFSLGQT